jgi:gamma-glutamylcyclotransferase (GGCT)/AIG2-like uncharacterized protein YtfP
MLVGVYGTLKKGYSNHRLLKNYNFIGTQLIKGYFKLYDLGPFPGIKPGDGNLFIEIYEVNDQVGLDSLDRLEGYPHLYDKDYIDTSFGEVLLYVYNGQINENKLIKDGFWYDTY